MGDRIIEASGTRRTDRSIYDDIATRTGGEFVVGVVGPVRTGKSTFIKRFAEGAMLPLIESEAKAAEVRDALPQSAGGRTVMTAEPKFIPDEAAELTLPSGGTLRMRLVDCVGYLVPSALGVEENGEERLVHTPWHDEPIPFTEAAEEGTRRVICDHSTIGVLVTSDGSFGEFSREEYAAAEERVAEELARAGKPFVVVVNSASPESEDAERLAKGLEEKYGAPVALIDATKLDGADAAAILELVLSDFPLCEIAVRAPEWISALDGDHELRAAFTAACAESAKGSSKVGDVTARFVPQLEARLTERLGCPEGVSASCESLSLAAGEAVVTVTLPQSMYYDTVSALTGLDVSSERSLLSALVDLADVKREWSKYAEAIDMVNEKGYGIVMPTVADLRLEEPEIVKQPGGYGVKLCARAPSIHMIRAAIETELSPVVGTEEQSEELVRSMLREFEDDPARIWESNLFGKSLYELVNEGLHSKLEHMPDDAREKFGETLARIINEGSGGLICIIL